MSNSQQNIQQILQKALSSWQNWQTGGEVLNRQPEVLHELQDGKTNRSFLVASGSFKAVIRVNAANSVSLGINRDRERKILQLLQTTGFVPKALFASDQVLVTAYCEGRQWTEADLNNANNRCALNFVLEQIQSIAAPDLQTRNYVDYCTDYINQLVESPKLIENSKLTERPELIEIILSAAAEIDKTVWQPVICHHDLVPENIIVTATGLILLDWEYAAMGHPALDYIRLYKSDLTSTKLAYDRHTIEQLEIVQRGMDDLWSMVQVV